MQLTKIKTTVLIDQTIDHLSVHADFLRLYSDSKTILCDIPISQIESIQIIGSNINIPARLIKMCNTSQIPLHLLTEYNKHNGSLYFSVHPNIQNRQSQFLACSDPKWQLYLAKQILSQKTHTQSLAFQQWNYDPARLIVMSNKIPKCHSQQSLMGNEGTSAVFYWDGFGQYISSIPSTPENQFSWKGRIKNPCLDPVNSMLSLAYSLLATQCQSSLTLNGLDPYLGILHSTNNDRPALVYDIMEVYRVLIVDLWVIGLIESGTFCPKDFVFTREGVCTLNAVTKNEYFRLWFKRLKYTKFSTLNHGDISITEFMDSNTKLIIEWFQKINNHKERDTGSTSKLAQRLITFDDINQFKNI